tara:strand:+ start:1274 stop:2764 length:1491 start_codon:yes stop_codon:yes gene_type:complete
VWEPDQVAFLLDSIYKDFPIGTVILWQTAERLAVEKDLGSFRLPEPKKEYPVNYVLDGQQRLTSLFSVFQTDLEPLDDNWVDIYFDMQAEENVQESLFVALSDAEVDLDRHFPVKTLFDTLAYRRACENLPDDKVANVDILQTKFREYDIQTQTFETDDRTKVAIVFERINRAGTNLDTFELLSAWSWSDDFDLVDNFKDLQQEIVEHGFADLCDEKELQLRICAGVITGETAPSHVINLQGSEIRAQFPKIKNGILGAIDFLRRELKVAHFKMLPFPSMIVPLSAFFATNKPDGQNYTDLQKRKIIIWFWRTIFNRRYSSDVNERQANDIVQLLALREDETHDFRYPSTDIRIDFEKGNFSSAGVNAKSLILLLVQLEPHSFLSGAKIELEKVLRRGSKHEFHHIFPMKYMIDRGRERREINVLSNICFLTRNDNVKIKAKAPSLYVAEMSNESRTKYLGEALCPENMTDDDFDNFVSERTKLILERAKGLMDIT